MAMEQIDKQYGKGSIMRLGGDADKMAQVEVIPTGAIALDLALGVGGFLEEELLKYMVQKHLEKLLLHYQLLHKHKKRWAMCIYRCRTCPRSNKSPNHWS